MGPGEFAFFVHGVKVETIPFWRFVGDLVSNKKLLSSMNSPDERAQWLDELMNDRLDQNDVISTKDSPSKNSLARLRERQQVEQDERRKKKVNDLFTFNSLMFTRLMGREFLLTLKMRPIAWHSFLKKADTVLVLLSNEGNQDNVALYRETVDQIKNKNKWRMSVTIVDCTQDPVLCLLPEVNAMNLLQHSHAVARLYRHGKSVAPALAMNFTFPFGDLVHWVQSKLKLP